MTASLGKRILKSLLLLLFFSVEARAADQSLTSQVFRINGKRYQKISLGSGSIYAPSIGLPLASSIAESLCPTQLDKGSDIFEISKPAPAGGDVQKLKEEITARIKICSQISVTSPSSKKSGGCSQTNKKPEYGPDGKVKEGTGSVGFDCKSDSGK